MQRQLVLLVLVMTGFAGCLSGTSSGEDCPIGPADHAETTILETTDDPIIDDHDHWDYVPHAVRTCSIIALSRNTLTGTDEAHKYIGELDVRADLNLGAVGVLLSVDDQSGVVLFNVTDRANPTELTFIPTPTFSPVDVKFSVEGDLLFVATQRTLRLDERVLQGTEQQVGSNGILVFDVSDPMNPIQVGFQLRPPGGCHMVRSVMIEGEEWVWCAWEGFWAYPITRTPTGVQFGAPTAYFRDEGGLPTPTGPASTRAYLEPVFEGAGHLDMQFYHDDGRTIMVASHWNAGLRVVDISNPRLAVELSRWTGEGATHYTGSVHTAQVVETSAGRFILASPELTSEDTIPSIWVFRADDWSNLEYVAEFTAQGEHPSQDLTFTIHQWQVAPRGPDVAPEDIRIYMTYNHAGVWVLDFATILAGDNIGAVKGFHSARAPIDEETLPSRAFLGSWDVALVDGYIYASDRATGLWTFHYTPDTLGDERLTGDQ